MIARVATLYYFLYFLVILPLLGRLERPLAAAGEHLHAGAARRRRRCPPAPRPSRWRRPDARSLALALAARALAAWAGCCSSPPAAGGPALAADEALHPPDTNFSFDGLFGTFDRASAQRGLPGLQGGLRQLPLDAAALLPRPRGSSA